MRSTGFLLLVLLPFFFSCVLNQRKRGWYSSVPTPCGNVSIPNGKVKLKDKNTVNVKCDPFFYPYGLSKQVICIKKTLTPLPFCAKPGCRLPGSIENGYWKTELEHSVLKVFCVDNFETHDASVIGCDGQNWSSPIPFCYPSNPSLVCDLNSGSLCGWQQGSVSSSYFTLQNKVNPFRMNDTGPDKDDSLDGLGKYLYLDNSIALEGKTPAVARIYSPVYAKSEENCFSFSYHMFGSKKLGTIRIFIVNAGQDVSNETVPNASVTGDQGDAWRQLNYFAATNTSTQWIIEAEIYDDENVAVIAIDNMQLTYSKCPSDLKPGLAFPSCKNRCTQDAEAQLSPSMCSCADKCGVSDNCCYDFNKYCSAGDNDVDQTSEEVVVAPTTTPKPRPTTATTRTTVSSTTSFKPTTQSSTLKTTSTVRTSTAARIVTKVAWITTYRTTTKVPEVKTTQSTVRTTVNTTTQTTSTTTSSKPRELPVTKPEEQRTLISGVLFWVIGIIGAVVVISLVKLVCGNVLRRRDVMREDGEGVAFISNDNDEPQLDFTLATPENVNKLSYDQL